MVERGELALLRQFDADGHLALSLYIDLSTSERRDEAIQRVTAALAPHFQENNGYGAEQAEALREHGAPVLQDQQEQPIAVCRHLFLCATVVLAGLPARRAY